MPVVIVEMWSGKTQEQKRGLVRAITDAMKEHAGVSGRSLHVIIHETPPESWGLDGKLGSDR